MIGFPLKPLDVKAAREKAAAMGRLRHSITQGAGNAAGFLGEILAARFLSAAIENTFDYDLVLPNGKTADVKTKVCTSTPYPNYECSVAAYNITQECDYYIFTRIKEDFQAGWLLGYLSKKDYFEKARFCRKGEVDEKSHLGWTFKEDCYNVEIAQLQDITELVSD